MHSLREALMVAQGVVADEHAVSTVVGGAVDTLGYERALVILNCGTFSATGTLDATVAECATSGGSYVAITGAVFTQVAAANDVTVYVGEIKLRAGTRKRYLKVSFVVGTDVVDAGCVVILARGHAEPVTQTNDAEFAV